MFKREDGTSVRTYEKDFSESIGDGLAVGDDVIVIRRVRGGYYSDVSRQVFAGKVSRETKTLIVAEYDYCGNKQEARFYKPGAPRSRWPYTTPGGSFGAHPQIARADYEPARIALARDTERVEKAARKRRDERTISDLADKIIKKGDADMLRRAAEALRKVVV